ncbi:MAG: hypothetical protein ACRD2U_07255 [Terriglobales bacterium]
MSDASRPMGRLFYFLAAIVAWVFLAAAVLSAQTPALTTITDTVYRADGTPAGGTLLISWPAFTTASSQAIAAGSKSAILGSNGALSVQLAPNSGATPSGTFYTVVYQLDDGTAKTEYWAVPTTSPTTIAAVRTTPGSSGQASQLATEEYVNTALAAKANDSAVVHLNGNETITGAKQFSVAPSLPAPVQPNDAVNKAYVDSSVTGSGSGSYVLKAGDIMTGPLALPADPVAPDQASTRHYVDIGLAAKAGLIAGVVPAGQLGNGSADNSVCLHGDSTWGGCGTSSNAVSIQSVPVDTTAPTDNQVITYIASVGKYEPRPGAGTTGGMQQIKYASDFNWSQTPSTDLSVAGSVTVNLPVCPPGVTGTEPWYYVYLAGTGTAEAVLVTGGTCSGNGQAGTLQFTTTSSHSAGYTISSASSGLQEALIGARYIPTNPAGTSQSGKVIVPPGQFIAYARVSIRASGMTVDFSGSIVECWMNDSCIFLGDPANSNSYSDITLISPRGRPTIVNGTHPFIEDNSQKARIFNVTTRVALNGGTFSNYVQVDDDESFLLDGLDTSLGYGTRCDATVCNPVVYAPGPFATYPAVGWLKNLNISLQCSGNGVDWQSGNTLRISDSVIQGFSQYGVRTGTRRGGYGPEKLENVYEEVGNCANPSGNIGQAGLIVQGSGVEVDGGEEPGTGTPIFANTGTTQYSYYVVPQNSGIGHGNPLYAGRALTNGSGNITITTPAIAGATSYDLLRVPVPSNSSEQAPYGTGNYAVVTGVSPSACANGVCTFTDSQAPLSSYTVAAPTYFPLLDFWPGAMVLGTNGDSGNQSSAALAWVQNIRGSVVSVLGTAGPAVYSNSCFPLGNWTPTWVSCFSSAAPQSFPAQGAMVLASKTNTDGGMQTNLKGRLNFCCVGTAPGHIVTLSDSNFQKTIATANNRPVNDVNDAFIGADQGDGSPLHVGISFGAPISLSNYIGNVGDGMNWLERLTSNLKEFKPNVQMDSSLTVVGTVQASSFVTTGSGAWSIQAGYGVLSPAATGKSLIGFGTNGKLQVSENSGAVVEVAKLDVNGNVTENANTATQLAQTPTQCSGSFATGIQANGNANCGTASVMQLAETSAPAGIPNYGLFWFDSSCHCPKVISNNGQAVQLGLTNVFNADANTLEEYNGATPQTFNVYGSRADAADYQRLRLSYDSADNYLFLGADATGTGAVPQPPGLGFWMQGSLRWVIDSAFNLKPWSDNIKDVGTPTLRLKHLYAGTYVDTTTGSVATDIPNESITGTTLNKLVKLTGAPGAAITASTSDTAGVIGIAVDGAGTSGSVQVARSGQAACAFDGATTANDYVQISGTVAGDCHDSGAPYPTGGQVLGRVLSTNAVAGSYAMLVGGEVQAPNANSAVSSVFGRTGPVVATSGDYSVAQVTGAAPLNSPALTGTPTSPTPATSDNSTAIATTAWVNNQGFGSGSGGAVTSVFGRAGTVTAGTGDYAVGQITGAAPIASPTFTGTPTAPTPATSDNSAKLATTAYVQSQTCPIWFTTPNAASTVNFTATANKAALWGIVLSCNLSTTQVTYDVTTADNTANTYDIGIVNSAGTVVAHIGSTAGTAFAASTGWKTLSWASGAQLPPGKYYAALSTNCTTACAVLEGGNSGAGLTYAANIPESVTTGGTLPATITVPADAYTVTTIPTFAIH